MVVDNIKEYSLLVNTIGNMEMKAMDTKLNIELESSVSNISSEMLNDLRCDLDSVVSNISSFHKVFRESNRIISENFTKLNISKRKNDMDSMLENLSIMVTEFAIMRKNIALNDSDIINESYANDLQLIYDNYLSEASNSLSLNNNIQVVELYEGLGSILTNIKTMFSSKHDKIVARDKQWLKDNKKKLFGLDWAGVQLEVPSDYKVSFASLINHHDIFDKECVNDTDGSKIRRFEDKQEDLKNGLDNYYRTGSSKREIGLRKVKGEGAREAVQFMYEYCNDFINGKKYIEGKLDTIMKDVGETEEEVTESYTSVYESSEIVLEESVTKSVKNAWSKVEDLDSKLGQALYGGIILNFARHFGLARASARASVKLATLGPDIKYIKHENEQSIKTLTTIAKKKPGKNKPLEDYIEWLKNDFTKMIEEKEEAINKRNKKIFKESIIYEADEEVKNKKDEDIDVDGELDDIENNNDEDDDPKKEEGKDKEEVKDDTEEAKSSRSKEKDRQTGITVLMTIAEERYFDYIGTLRELVE